MNREAQYTAQREADHSASADCGHQSDLNNVRDRAANSRQSLQICERELDRRMSNMEADLRQNAPENLRSVAESLRKSAEDTLDKAQTAARALFKMVEAGLSNASNDERRSLSHLATNVNERIQDASSTLRENSKQLTADVVNSLDHNNMHHVQDALVRAQQENEQIQKRLQDDMIRATEVASRLLNEQLRNQELQEAEFREAQRRRELER